MNRIKLVDRIKPWHAFVAGFVFAAILDFLGVPPWLNILLAFLVGLVVLTVIAIVYRPR